MITWLEGKKSYCLAIALFGYSLGGYFTGHLTGQETLGLIWSSGVTATLRAAITKVKPLVKL